MKKLYTVELAAHMSVYALYTSQCCRFSALPNSAARCAAGDADRRSVHSVSALTSSLPRCNNTCTSTPSLSTENMSFPGDVDTEAVQGFWPCHTWSFREFTALTQARGHRYIKSYKRSDSRNIRTTVWNSLADYLRDLALERNCFRRQFKILLFAHYRHNEPSALDI